MLEMMYLGLSGETKTQARQYNRKAAGIKILVIDFSFIMNQDICKLWNDRALNFLTNLRKTEEVYRAAVYGALYNETELLDTLKRLGSKSSAQELEKSRYRKTQKIINALTEKSDDMIPLSALKGRIRLSRKIIRENLTIVQNVPKIAREQLVVTYATLLEGFIHDTILDFFKIQPQSLKSNKATLKDWQLIESLLEGNALDKLIEIRVREIMYNSISGWIVHFNDVGFDIKEETALKEMFLVRNVIIHNSKKVGPELANGITNGRYLLGREVKVTEKDIKRFRLAISRLMIQIKEGFFRQTAKKITTN